MCVGQARDCLPHAEEMKLTVMFCRPGQYKLMSPRQIASVIDQSGASKKKPPPAITLAKKPAKVSEESQVKVLA
jgi:hypothetical protein